MNGEHRLVDTETLVLSVRRSSSTLEFRVCGGDSDLWLRVPEQSVPDLVAYLERLTLPQAGGSTGDRLVRCLAALVAGRDLGGDAAASVQRQRVADWCTDAGVPYECVDVVAGADRRTFRSQPLHRFTDEWGYRHTLAVEFSPQPSGHGSRDSTVRFVESHVLPGESTSRLDLYADTEYPGLDRLAASFASSSADSSSPVGATTVDHEDRVIAGLASLVERGELGSPTVAGQARGLVANLFRDAGVTVRLTGETPQHTVVGALDGDGVRGVEFRLILEYTPNRPQPSLVVTERYQQVGRVEGAVSYSVEAPLASVDALVAVLERRLGRESPGRWGPDRLLDCLRSMVERSELAAGLPRRVNRAQIVACCEAAGVPYVCTESGRRERIVFVNDTSADRIFSLSLNLDARRAVRGICFSEYYDYGAVGGTEGREYGYQVYAPYNELETLVAYFERMIETPRPGVRRVPDGPFADVAHQADLEDRLVSCFMALRSRGELGGMGTSGLGGIRDQVADWFDHAGVPCEKDLWTWFDFPDD